MKSTSRFTKILGTLGPATSDRKILRTMLEAGLDGARLNMSHGSHSEHRARIRALKKEAQAMGRALAVVLDLQGPKIRTAGRIAAGEVELRRGTQVTLVGRAVPATSELLGVGLPSFARQVRPQERVLIDDGKLRLRVRKVREQEVVCDVEVGGWIKERRGINLPDSELQLATLTRKDLRDLAFGFEIGVDYVALSFVASSADIHSLRRRMTRMGGDLPIIAKLERPMALENLEDILDSAEGVMVARGDLGVEIPVEEVPAAQKQIIARAGERGRLCITATQMLETMIHASQPTRAEVSDVANAVFDGTDAVMLSGETAVGHDPVGVIQMMARIVRGAERPLRPSSWRVATNPERRVKSVLARAAAEASQEIEAEALICLTMSGRTALRVSKHRCPVPILAVTPLRATERRAALYWGVHPIQHRFVQNSDRLRRGVEKQLMRLRYVRAGDLVAYLGGSQPGDFATDFLQLRRIEPEERRSSRRRGPHPDNADRKTSARRKPSKD